MSACSQVAPARPHEPADKNVGAPPATRECAPRGRGNDFGRAVSRILSALLRAERIICLSSQYPEPVPPCGTWSGPLRGSLFGLAPDGVFRASALALGAVGSYPTFSPLPALLAKRRRYLLCGTVRRHASRHGLPRVSVSRPSCVGLRRLRGIVPCGVRTFLLPRITSRKAILRPSKIKLNIGPHPRVGKRLRPGCIKLDAGRVRKVGTPRRGVRVWAGTDASAKRPYLEGLVASLMPPCPFVGASGLKQTS